LFLKFKENQKAAEITLRTRLTKLLRAFLARLAKITTEKTQISILTTYFSIHTRTDSLFYSLFSLNIILCGRE
jgi:hypothetical protein